MNQLLDLREKIDETERWVAGFQDCEVPALKQWAEKELFDTAFRKAQLQKAIRREQVHNIVRLLGITAGLTVLVLYFSGLL